MASMRVMDKMTLLDVDTYPRDTDTPWRKRCPLMRKAIQPLSLSPEPPRRSAPPVIVQTQTENCNFTWLENQNIPMKLAQRKREKKNKTGSPRARKGAIAEDGFDPLCLACRPSTLPLDHSAAYVYGNKAPDSWAYRGTLVVSGRG